MEILDAPPSTPLLCISREEFADFGLFPVASDGFVIGKYVINFDANEPRYLPEIHIIVSFPVCFTHTHINRQVCLWWDRERGDCISISDCSTVAVRNFLKFQTCLRKVCKKEKKKNGERKNLYERSWEESVYITNSFKIILFLKIRSGKSFYSTIAIEATYFFLKGLTFFHWCNE